jgi:type I restriction enzyme S subunit
MSINNEHKQGYKHTPLGWIPEEWHVSDLNKVCDVKGRIGYRGYTTNDIVPKGSGAITVSPSNIFENELKFESNTYISWFKYDESPEIQLQENDILLVKTGSTYGKSALVKSLSEKATINPQLVVIKNVRCNVPYLSYVISSNIIQRQIRATVVGGAIPTLSQENILNFIFPYAPLLEQNKIAAILSTWDKAITKTQQLIAQLQQRNKGMMQQLLTGKKRLKGFEGEWKRLHIYDVAKEVSLKNRDDKQLTVLSSTKYDGLVPSLEYFGRRVFGSDTSTYKVVPLHHFAYATNHIEEGSIGYQSIFEEALISPMYTVFKTDEQVHDDYLFKLLKSHHYIHEYCRRMEGSIDRRGGLRWDEFSKIILHLPELEEQKAIATLTNKAVEVVKLYEQKLASLQQQKKGLMQKLLTGEVRVKITKQ